MLIISLDEQGQFEELPANDGTMESPAFIGGIVFDDLDIDGEYQKEQKRIRLYLKSVCKQAGTSYPQDLHVGNDNQAKVKLTKQLISATLSDFLREGKWRLADNEYSVQLNESAPRRGKYTIFIYMKYGTGIRKLDAGHTSNLVREGYAGNLYLHMAEEVVGRLIFHNPVIADIKKVRLELATRRVIVDANSAREKEYVNLGYRRDPDASHQQNGKSTFILTNADIYRTAMEREMLNTDQRHIWIDRLAVKSIYYGDEGSRNGMQFLYLADIICSMLGFRPDRSSPAALINEMKKRADDYTGHDDNLIFAYDDADLIFRKAWEKLEDKDYYGALEYAHQGKKADSPYAEFYDQHWFRRLKEQLQKDADKDALSVALRRYFLLTHTNGLEQDELIDMYFALESMAQGMTFGKGENAVLYELYDAGTSAFCHIGDSARAEMCFAKCCEYAKYVEIERYLRTRNKMVVYLTDSFAFDRALSVAQENVIFQEELLGVRELVFDAQEASKYYGLALSQLGQIQSSLHMREGEQIFLNALAQLGGDTAPDYLQTESYLLHYYIEMGEKEKYDRWAEHYFGGNRNLAKQLRYLIREAEKGEAARFSMKFALYVYVKGLLSFHMEDISDSLLKKLLNVETEIKETGGEAAVRQINNHPWEIIYKILAVIAFRTGNPQIADEYMEKAGRILTWRGFTLDVIGLFGKLEYAMERGERAEALQLMEQLTKEFAKNHSDICRQTESRTLEDGFLYLKENVINYMYR